MSRMKLGVVLPASLALVAALAATPAELGQIRSVYLLSMGSGFDQYLANQLTTQEVFQVVTDPQMADAVLTDQIGLRFEKQLETALLADDSWDDVVEPDAPVLGAVDTAYSGEVPAPQRILVE